MLDSTDRTDVDNAADNRHGIESICLVVAECFGVNRARLSADTALTVDLGADSLDCLALAIEFEKAFDVIISDQALFGFQRIGDIQSCIAAILQLRDNRQTGEPPTLEAATLAMNRNEYELGSDPVKLENGLRHG